MWLSEIEALSRVWQHVKLSDVSLGTSPRYRLVFDEDVKPNQQFKMEWKGIQNMVTLQGVCGKRSQIVKVQSGRRDYEKKLLLWWDCLSKLPIKSVLLKLFFCKNPYKMRHNVRIESILKTSASL